MSLARVWSEWDDDGDRWTSARVGPILITLFACHSEGGGFVSVWWRPNTRHCRRLFSRVWM